MTAVRRQFLIDAYEDAIPLTYPNVLVIKGVARLSGRSGVDGDLLRQRTIFRLHRA